MTHQLFTQKERAHEAPSSHKTLRRYWRFYASFAAMLVTLLGVSISAANAQDTAITCSPNWGAYGNPGFSAGGPSTFPSMVFSSTGVPYIAYRDGGNGGKLTVSKYIGTGLTGWTPVASAGFTVGAVNYTNLCIDNSDSLWVAYKDEGSGKLIVRKFDGTNWNTVGAAMSVGAADFVSMHLDATGVPFVAYRDFSNGRLSVKKLSSGSWVDVGSTYVTSASIHVNARITIDFAGSTPYVAYRETNGKLSVIRYTSSSWESVGGVFTDSTDYPSLAISGSTPYVTYMDMSASKKATVKKFDGTSWVTVGTTGFSPGVSTWNDITINSEGQPVVIFKSDSILAKCNVMAFDGTNWISKGNPYFSGAGTYYNQVYVDASGNYWCSYVDDLYNQKVSVLRLTTSVLQPITGANFVCTGTSITLANTTGGGVWSSSAPSLASIGSATGIMQGLSAGTVNVSYTLFAGCARGKTVTVNSSPINLTGGTSPFCVAATATLASSGGIYWSSSNTDVATVGSTGIVTGVSGGTAIITTTTSGGCIRTKEVTVNPLPAISDITGNFIVATSGITSQLSATPTGGTWTSGNSVVSVNSSGLVTGSTTAGTSVISYRLLSAGCVGTVTAVVTNRAMAPGLHFDGTNDHISFTDGFSTLTDFTFEAWVKPTSAVSNARLFDFGSSATSDMYFVTSDGTTGIPKFGIISGGVEQSVAGTSALSTTAWSHLAVTIGGGSAKLYVNGVLVGTNSSFTHTPSTIGATTSNNIGRSITGTNHFMGSMDEVRFWSSSRTAEQIQANRNCDIEPQTGLVAVYRFNNGTVSGANSTANVAVDYSGSNKCGTLNNFALTGTTSNYVNGAIGLCNTVVAPTFSVTPVAAVCAGQNITMSTSGTGGSWSSTNSAAGTIDASTGIFTAIAAGTTTVSYTVVVNCISTAFSTVVTVNAQPSVISGTLSACEGNTSTLSATPVSGTWSSSIPAVGTVSTSGVVAGLVAGTTTISYQHPTTGCARTVVFTVNGLPSAIVGTTAIDLTATTTLTATPSGGSWASANTTVASVNATTGVVTGNASGTTTISYSTTAGCASTTTFTVNLAAISGATSTCIGVPITLSHPITGGTWVSSNPEIASVGSSSGVVTGVTTGTSVITYNAIGLSRTVVITVLGTAPVISGTTTLCATSATTLSATPTSGSWTSSNTSIANVNGVTGVVTGVATGSAVVTYTLGSCYSTATVIVAAPLAAITGNNTLCLGGSIALSNSAGSGVWSTSAAGTASVNTTTGVVSAVSIGSVVITYATSPSCYATKSVSVTAAPSSITGTASVCQGSTTTLSHSTPSGTWISGTTSVATVNASGVVTGVAAGTSSISYYTSEGCFTTVVVTVSALPSAIGGTATVCESATTTLTGSGAGTWSSSNTDVATIGNTTGVVSGILAGTSTIVFTLNSTGCSISRVVTVNALPSAIGGSLTVCAGSNTSLSTTPSGGTWVSTTAATATIDEATGILSGVAAGTTIISYTTTSGCRRTAIATVNALPAVISGSASLCDGSTTTLTSATASQTWSSSNIAVATVATGTSTTGIVTANAIGTATISYTNANGCSRTMVVTVTSAPPTISGDDIVCLGGNTTLTNTASGGSWTSSNTARATVNAVTGTVTGVGTGLVVVSYSLGTTCYVTKQLTVNAAPSAISGGGAVCIGSSLTLTHAVSSGTWSSLSANITIGATTGVVTGVAAGTALVTYNTSAGCFVTTVVTVNASPSAITGTATLCEGATTTLAGSGTGTWATQSGAIATVSTSTGVVSGVAAGTTNITFTLTSTGCNTTRVVTVNPQPASITGATSVCSGFTVPQSNTTTGGNWASSAPSVATIASDGTITGVAVGTSLISYTLASGCRTTRIITVNTAPAIITGSLGLCVGSTTTLASATTGQTWSSTTTGVASIDPSSGLVTALSVGTTTISYTSASGCARTAIVTVSNAASPILGDDEVCIGATTILSNATSGGSWTSSNTSRATVNAVSGGVTGVAAGTVIITYQVSAGCFVAKTMTVSTSPADPITGPNKVCVGSMITLSYPVTGGTWTSSNLPRASVDASTGDVTGVGAGTVTITYYTNAGCYRTYTLSVNALPANINGSAVVCEGATTTLTNATAGGSWINNGAFCTVANTTGVVTGVNAGIGIVSYVVAATGCTITKQVTVNPQPSSIAGATSVCVGGTSSLSSTPTGGTWVSSTISRASVGMTSGVLGGVSVGTVIITYALPNGCRTTTVASVMASPAALTGTNSVCIGGNTTITAGNAGFTWSSSNPSIATVATASTITGLVTGLSVGTTEISYTNSTGCATKMIVTVTASGASISGPDAVCIGGTISLINTGGTWSSSNTSKATITSAGVVTGVAAGTSTITYRTSTTCFVTKNITVNTSPADAITGPSTVCQSADISLSHPLSGGTWSSSLSVRASVDATSGVVTGISAGTVIITYATQPGCFRTYPVTVSPYVFPISGKYVVCKGTTTTLTSAGAGGTWSSQIPAIATINPVNGFLTGVNDGTVTIVYTMPTGCSSVKEITVNALPSTIAGPSTLCVGSNITLSSTPTGGTWMTGAGIYGTVNATTGVVTGITAASVNITYTAPNTCIAVKNLTVNPIPGAISGLSTLGTITNTTATLTSTPAGGQWTSSDGSIANIGLANGVINSVGVGTSTITYTIPATGCFRTRVQTVVAGRPMTGNVNSSEGAGITRIFPTPTTGTLTIEASVPGTFRVTAIDGRTVAQYVISEHATTINLPQDLAAGIYTCQFIGTDGVVEVMKVVLTK